MAKKKTSRRKTAKLEFPFIKFIFFLILVPLVLMMFVAVFAERQDKAVDASSYSVTK